MSGSGEYTTTPNLGLFKPTYNADAENWGFHINSNSDTLDAALVGGGSYIATGGTAPRTAADRAADVANVLDFGADPTGVADSSAAINLAASQQTSNGRYKAVYLPAGLYRVNHQINLTGAQAFFGDSRGSSVLIVDQAFDPNATAVIFCTSGGLDPGPVIRDFGITFMQPQTTGLTRATFRTLAAGGTSGPGGTGIKYPWAIASGSSAIRIQVMRVRIGGAWDGITTNANNVVYWLEDIEMGALDCGFSLGEGAESLDFNHISGFHFWNFELNTTTLYDIFNDGQTIALRLAKGGINIRDFSSFCGRIVITPEAAGSAALEITNCMMDGDKSTIEVDGIMQHFHIANIYGTSSTTRVRPFIQVNAKCPMHISNWYSSSQANQQDIVLNDPDAEVTLDNFHAIFFTDNIRWAEVQRGVLRLVNGFLYLNGPRTVAAIAETSNGHLIVDNVTVQAATPSGPLISVVTTGDWTMIGRIQVQNGNTWTYTLPAGLTQRFFSPKTVFQNGEVDAASFFANTLVQVGQTVSGGAGTVALVGAPGEQKVFSISRGAGPAWALLSSGATDDFAILRWDDGGTYQGAPLAITRATGAVTLPLLNGTSFGANVGSTNIDMSKHITMHSGGYGLSVTGNRLNLICPGGAAGIIVSNNTDVFSASDTAVKIPRLPATISYTNDAAAAAGGVVVGQLYRNGSAVMCRIT